MGLCAISVDLDEIPHYFGIHGLPKPTGPEAHLVYDVALPRLDSLSNTFGIPLTLFAVGSDVTRPENAEVLRDLSARGHEIGNHSLDHRYDLTRLPAAEQTRQVAESMDRLEQATGARPRGFRSPGYTVTDTLYRILEDLGVLYSSSVFPCPPYYLAKAFTMALMRCRGRRSQAILDIPEVLLAPTSPYRVGRPYWEPGTGIWELPIQVTRVLRLPFIGTSLTLAGVEGAMRLTRELLGEPFVNLELHGIDVLDADDGLGPLSGFQPDLRVPVRKKTAILSAVVELLEQEGYEFVRLDRALESYR